MVVVILVVVLCGSRDPSSSVCAVVVNPSSSVVW